MNEKSTAARDAHAERATAQPECIRFLNSIGRAEKHRDGVSGQVTVRCTHCRKVHQSYVTLIPHTETGVADYIGCVARENTPPAYAVEVKAGGLVFPMNRIDDDQWTWLQRWEEDTLGTAWFWIMFGTQQVATKSPFARMTYLVPRAVVREVYDEILDCTSGRQTTLPMNRSVERIRLTDIYRENNLFADVRFGEYKMEWQGAGMWRPNPNHLWWGLYGEGVGKNGTETAKQQRLSI